MDLGFLEGQTSRGLFSNSIFDPSVIGANVDCMGGVLREADMVLEKHGW